ncbi:MAG: hypothetical protein IJ660_05705 [Alphaproteobacteria bacterium]|nr:hypothetical protein [Alphaproteobacteria bacterium]
MFKIIKENKIIGISEEYPALLDKYEVVEDTAHQVSDYKHYDGEFTLHNIEKDNEEMKQARANAYQVEVDPITAHIQRLKDETPVPKGEIAELIAEREAKVQEIKERYPYDR